MEHPNDLQVVFAQKVVIFHNLAWHFYPSRTTADTFLALN